jgi:Protein of unknown function (DUF1761)
MTTQLLATIIAALIPMIVGFIWYSTKVFGNAWMKASGLSLEDLRQNFNPLKSYGLCFLLSVLLAFMIQAIVIHQSAFGSLLADPTKMTPEVFAAIEAVKVSTANLYRTFGHGFFHGVLFCIFVVLPIIGIPAIFERKSAKYVFIHWGYWTITIALMGGIICQWGGLGI